MREDILVGRFQKNAREEVRVTLHNYKGNDLLDIRAWYADPDGEFKPGKRGLSVRVEKLPILLDLLTEARKKAIDEGMLD